MNFVGYINIERKEIEIDNCKILFNYVDYILDKNGNKNICHEMKVDYFQISTHINFHVYFYDKETSLLATINSKFLGGIDENYVYMLSHKNRQNHNTNYSHSQNILKESIIEKLNIIKDEILKIKF